MQQRKKADKQLTTAWVLVNVGTPEHPSTGAVRKYLREFLDDPKVIDLPFLLRKFLVHAIIVPFRAPRSAKKYSQIWTAEGSPLLIHMNQLVQKLQDLAPAGTDVFGTMRYGRPALKHFLQELHAKQYNKVIILPLYPQYADSTTGSVEHLVESVRKQQSQLQSLPRDIPGKSSTTPRIIDQFYNHPGFLASFAEQIRALDPSTFDHILFSYHGLPLRQLHKGHPGQAVNDCNCHLVMPAHGNHCYRATCYATSRLLAAAAGIAPESCSTSFQSRLSRNWMTPFTDETLIRLAREGKKKVLVIPASFVADCLETTLEIGMEYRELFIENGGEELVMTESLNSSDRWVKTVHELLREATMGGSAR